MAIRVLWLARGATVIPWELLSDASGWTVATFMGIAGVMLVFTGRIVPRRTLKDMIEERNMWRTTATTQADSIGKLTHQLDEARIVVRANSAFLQALPRADQGAQDDAIH